MVITLHSEKENKIPKSKIQNFSILLFKWSGMVLCLNGMIYIDHIFFRNTKKPLLTQIHILKKGV